MEKRKLILRVGENEIMFKFLVSPINSFTSHETLCFTNHDLNEKSFLLREIKPKAPFEAPKDQSCFKGAIV